MKTAIVTGGNGFVGSHLVARLLRDGWRIHALGRARGTCSWPSRMRGAVAEVDDALMARDWAGHLFCHDVADLGDAESIVHAGIPYSPHGSPTVLFNVAGNTCFDAADSDAQRRVNVEACPALLRALGWSIDSVVHVSTAYVCGTRRGCIREDDADLGQRFHNAYERTKLEGELRTRRACEAQGIPLAIARPSIVTNSAVTGRSSAFTHLNALVAVIHRLQARYGLAFGESLSDRVRTVIDPDCRPNVIPVDAVVNALAALAERHREGTRTYHLCHPNPPTNRQIIGALLRALNLADKVDVRYVERLPAPVSYTERMLVRSFKPYAPYLCNPLDFALANTRAAVPDYDAGIPRLDTAYMRRAVAYLSAHGRRWLGNPHAGPSPTVCRAA